MKTNYAAVQIETRSVFGVGNSPDEARADAHSNGSNGGETSADRLHVTTITEAARAYVEENGGGPCQAISFDRNGICLRDEE